MKRTIAIVCGGDSSEHDVSLRSAEGLNSFFSHEDYDIYIADIKRGDWHVCLPDGQKAPIDRNDFSFEVADNQCLCKQPWEGKGVEFSVEMTRKRRVRPDYAYITIHGTPGEDGLLQGYFDLIGMPYSTSGALVEAMTFDKFVLNNYLRGFGVRVADSILLRRDDPSMPSPSEIAARLGLPCFVKPAADGSSYGVTKAKTTAEMADAIAKAFLEGDEVMAEAMLHGMEISQGCYKTRAHKVVLPATEVETTREFFDYEAKYNGQVEEITPARLKPETAERVAAETSRIYDILHCNGIIRVDYIITPQADGPDLINMLEINTTPGMTATSFIPQQVRAAGLDMGAVLKEIVENQF